MAGEGGSDGEPPEGGRCLPVVAGPAVPVWPGGAYDFAIAMFQVRGRNLKVALPGVKVSRPQMQLRYGWYLWEDQPAPLTGANRRLGRAQPHLEPRDQP